MDTGRRLQLKESPMGHLQLWRHECAYIRSRARRSEVRLLVCSGFKPADGH